MKWNYYPLKKVAPSATSKSKFSDADQVWHLNLDQIESHTGAIIKKKMAPASKAGNSTYVFDTNNVLYSKLRPYLNKVVCPEEPGLATTELVPLCPQPQLLDRKFLTYFLRSNLFLNFASMVVTGAKMPRVIMTKFWDYEIPLPPLSEQRRIVEMLDQADRLRKLRAEANKEAERILTSGFYNNFGNPTLSHSVPDAFPLGKLVKINPKKSEIKDLSNQDIVSFVPMNAVDERYGRIVNSEQRQLAEVKTGFTYFREGDVLFAKITPCMENGKAAIAINLKNKVGFGSTEFHVLRPGTGVTAEWIFGLIRLPMFRVFAQQRFTGAVGQQRVPVDFLETFPVRRPQKDNLQAFTLMFRGVMAYIKKNEKASHSIEKLFSVLLHRAFTGDLTASWREAHMKELLQEMEIQAKALAI